MFKILGPQSPEEQTFLKYTFKDLCGSFEFAVSAELQNH